MKIDLVCEAPVVGIVRLHPIPWNYDVEVTWTGAPTVQQKANAINYLEHEGWKEAAQGKIPYDQNFGLDIG